MEQRIKRVRQLFTWSIVGLCVASMALLLGTLYVTSSISFDKSTSPGQLESLTEDYPAVAAYLQQEKKSEAHFITIANLVKQDQQQLLGKAALLVALPLLCISGLLGYVLARYLLQPVNDMFASQERFLQDAAHELRNPLATMSAVIQQARHAKKDTDTAKSLGILERQTNHLVRINEDLLFLESKHQADEPPIDAGDLLRDVAETLQPLASAQTIRVKVDIPKEGIILAVRKKDFICLARNLLENAIKYSANSKKPTVTASLVKDSKHTVFTVRDNGIGIATQDLPHMGQRFYRGRNVGRHEGSGLGLAIVYKVAAAYGAGVQIQSTEGRGTTVHVTFRS